MDVPLANGLPPLTRAQPPSPKVTPPAVAGPDASAGAPPHGDVVEISLFGRVLQAVKEFGEVNRTALHNAVEEMTDHPAGSPASFKRVLADRIDESLTHLSDPDTDRPGLDLVL